jgi:hypothetical protein
MRICLGIAFVVFAFSGAAWAQAADPSNDKTGSDRFATCDIRQVITKITRTKVPAQASASCDTGGGGIKSCQVSAGATANNYVLDNGDIRNACYKLPDGGDNPCAFVQYGPVVFASDKSAAQSFTTNSGRVTVQLNIGQFEVSQTIESDTVTQADLHLVIGKQFIVKRTNVVNSTVSLECTKANGEQFINLVPGNDNSGGKIKQVSVEGGGAFDLYVFQVSP